MMTLEQRADKIFHKEVLKARSVRKAIPESEGDGFCPWLRVTRADEDGSRMRLPWKNEQHKREMMHAVGLFAASVEAEFVTFVSDTRQVDLANFCAAHKLPDPNVDPYAAQEGYTKILHEQYKGYAGNLHPRFFMDAVIVGQKGPALEQRLVTIPYFFDEHHRFQFLEMRDSRDSDARLHDVEIAIVPDFWKFSREEVDDFRLTVMRSFFTARGTESA